MEIRQFTYPVDLVKDVDGRIVARVADLQGCVTDGADRAEALVEAADALEEALCAYMHLKKDIPVPSAPNGRPVVAPGVSIAAKVALYQAMRDGNRTNVWLAKEMGIVESEVRRFLDPKHPTKIRRLEEALAVLGRRMVISVEAA